MKFIAKIALTTLGIMFLLVLPFVLTKPEAPEVVQPKPLSFIVEEYFRCVGLGENEVIGNCLNAHAVYAYDTYGTQTVTEQLDTLPLQDRNLWCHEVMHYLGWRAYQKEGSVAKAFLDASELCDSGMYHGIMEEYLRKNGLEGNVEGLIKTVCVEALKEHPNFSEGTRSLCYHGLGHGLMYITGSDLLKSLDYCDTLGDFDTNSCYGGVFMEHTTSKQIGPASNNKDLKDHTYCKNLREHQKIDCYARQGANNFSFTGGVVKPAMEMCLELEPQYQYVCFQGVGTNNPAPSKPHSEASMGCRTAFEVSTDAYTACIEGSLGFVVQLDRGESGGAKLFCDIAYDEFKILCFENMGKNLRYWLNPQETIEEKCALIPEEPYRRACERSGPLR